MNIKHIIDNNIKETQVEITTTETDKDDYQLITNLISNHNINIKVYDKRNNIKYIPINEIHYFERLKDSNTKVICNNQTYTTKMNLKEIKENYVNNNLIMISRYIIVNLDYIDYATLLKNSQIALHLTNNKQVIVNRTYLKSFTKALKQKKEGI